MKEIKFLKDLPIKPTNANQKVLKVIGGDIYYDADGNRYGYITFKNVSKSPIFSLQLFIREYTIDGNEGGKFVRDTEYFQPYVYYEEGEFVIDEPILLDKDTDAIDVTIVKVTLNGRNFVNDKFVPFKKEDYADLYQKKAPVKKPGTATPFPTFAQPADAPARENSELVFDENGGVIEQQPAAAPNGPASNVQVNQFAKVQPNFMRFIYPVIGIIILIILFFTISSIVTAGVNAFNNSL